MSILATNDKELIYIYSDKSDLGKKVLAYTQSIDKSLRIINIEKETISDTIWLEIADMVNEPLEKLFSFELLSTPELSKQTDYDITDLLKIINKNPFLLKNPIAINGEKAKSINNRFDFFEFYDKDGSNFDKSPEAIKDAKHEDTTKDNGIKNNINS